MRIIKDAFLKASAEQYPKAEKYLAAWRTTVRAATWRNFTELRGTYPSADLVEVGSGNSVVVFNVCGNTYRLIAAVHFRTQIVYTLRFMTHAEYSRDNLEESVMKKSKLAFEKLPKDYAGLCRAFLPRPIRDPVDYANTTKMADAMALSNESFTPDQADYFELICSLIEDYDARNVRWPRVSGTDALKHLLEEHNLSAADLSRILGGSRNLGAMILRGDRKLTLNHVRKLSRRFGVSADLFFG